MDSKKKTSTSPNRRERQLIMKTGRGTTERERDTDGQKKRERGMEDAVHMKKEDKSLILIDIENVVTTGERCCHLS